MCSVSCEQSLVEKNIRLVGYFVGKNRKPHGISYEDWIGELYLSLVKSAKYWDHGKGASFAQFALVGFEITRRSHTRKAFLVKHKTVPQISQLGDGAAYAEPEDSGWSPEDCAINMELAEIARKALNSLRRHNNSWHASVKGMISGKSFEEIASDKRLKRSRETVRINCLKGLAWLARNINKKGIFDD